MGDHEEKGCVHIENWIDYCVKRKSKNENIEVLTVKQSINETKQNIAKGNIRYSPRKPENFTIELTIVKKEILITLNQVARQMVK